VQSLNKLNRGLGCGFLLAVNLLMSCTAEKSPNPLNSEAYNVSGLEIGMPEAEVLVLMGQPRKTENITLAGDYSEYVYDKLTVSLFANGPRLDSPRAVSSIYSRSKAHCFNAVICPGDTLESVKDILGEQELLPKEADKPARLFYLLPKLETCWLGIFTEDLENSSEISIACQP
jgi:hypothetical protein